LKTYPTPLKRFTILYFLISFTAKKRFCIARFKNDCSKAKSRLGWQPTWRLAQTLERIILWHQAWLAGENMKAVCLQEIKSYEHDFSKKAFTL